MRPLCARVKATLARRQSETNPTTPRSLARTFLVKVPRSKKMRKEGSICVGADQICG